MKSTIHGGISLATVLVIGSFFSGPALARAEEGRSTLGKEARITLTDAKSGTTLVLEPPVRADRIAGTFTRGALGVRFSSVSTQDGIRFVLRALDGRELFSLTQDQKHIENRLLGGRLLHQVDLSLLELFKSKDDSEGHVAALELAGTFVVGDSAIAKEFLAAPELALLPRLSRTLGQELGYTGATLPATLPLHLMASNLNRQGIGWVAPVPTPFSSNKCEPLPNYENQCYGMCGSGCSCWWFICGDCCYHSGCAEHDSTCRPGMEYSWYYCNIEFWTPFKEGGGCGEQ